LLLLAGAPLPQEARSDVALHALAFLSPLCVRRPRIGDTQIELVQPLGDEGELVDFLRTTGGGLHHIALETEDAIQSVDRLEKFGIRMKDRIPRSGANNSKVAFAEREGFDGVVIELVQPANKSLDPS
jgi:methylmalonyl-CoA epimerase